MPEQSTDGQNDNSNDQTSMADIAAGIKVASDDGSSQDLETQPVKGKSENVTDFEKFVKTQTEQMESLKSDVTNANEQVTEILNREQQVVLNKAVDDAVANITDGVEGKTKLADTFLNTAYRNDANFKKVFDARNENSEAYGKAVDILKEEFKAMTLNTIDPLVAENQRALQESQKAGSTVQDASETEKFNKMSDGDFMRDMRKRARAG